MIIFNFTDGKTCAHDSLQRPRNVVLRLYCSPDAPSDGAPEFTGEKSAYCTYEISWPRPELCKYSVRDSDCSLEPTVKSDWFNYWVTAIARTRVWTPVMTGYRCECELLLSILSPKTNLGMRWTINTDSCSGLSPNWWKTSI